MQTSTFSAVSLLLAVPLLFGSCSTALRFDEQYTDYNLNQNETATDPSDYFGIWDNHTFFPSPINWRVPFYTLFLDKFVNGDPTNDDINGTSFEHDVM
jgi:alpha-1,3-glucan synthase